MLLAILACLCWLTDSLKAGWASILIYSLSLWFSQTSILMLYLRIWTTPWVRKVTYAMLILVVVYNILVIITICTACIPLAAFWDFSIVPTYCHPKRIWYTNTYVHIITDFLMFCIPIPVIVSLRFPKRQKYLLLFIFTFGFL